MNAFYRAALADAPDDPAFLATLVPDDPVYTHAIGYLTELATEGAVGPATWRVGNAAVSSASATTATVTGCSFDTGSRWRQTGAATPPSLGGGSGYTATEASLVLRHGRWLVARAATSQVEPGEPGPCHGF